MRDLKRISVEESEQYISSENDFKNTFIAFYTLTPSEDPLYPASEDWDQVDYFTKRTKKPIPTVGEGKEIVYIMSNPSFPNLLKIGYTGKEVELRRLKLSKFTGVPTPFKVEFVYRLQGRGEEMEREVHAYLEEYRPSKQREFFEVTLKQAIEAVKFVGKNYI